MNQIIKEPCHWCGCYHQGMCPRVKSVEYEFGGTMIKRVEFFAPNDYPPLPTPLQPEPKA